MRPSGEPVSGRSLHCEPAPEVALPLLRAGEDPALAVAEADNFALGDEAPDPSPCFPVDTSSTVTAVVPLTTAAVTQSQVPVSEGESVPIVPAGPARAILQCFAGQAQLAAALNRQGLFAYGVDRVKRKSALAPVLQMDFSSRSTCDSVLTWLDRQKIAGVMMCIPKHPPESLTLAFMFAVIAGCLEKNLPLVLEGNTRAPFWESLEHLPVSQRPQHTLQVNWDIWDPCHHGRSLVMSNLPEVCTLRRDAPTQVAKSPFQHFKPDGYPAAFATALAAVFQSGMSARALSCSTPARINKAARVAAMHQPRGVMAALVPEWKLVVYVLLPRAVVQDPFSGGKRLQQDWQVPSDVRVLPGLATLPKDSQLLSRTQTGGTLSPQLQREMKQLNGDTVLRVGIPWDPIEFINKAGKTGHPFHQLSKTNTPLEELIEQLVHKPSSVRSRRKSYLDKWTKRSRILEPEEEKLKSSMSEHRKHILGSKRILLFKEMLEDVGYDDVEVVNEFISGATLTGGVPVTGVLDVNLKPARIELEQLMEISEQVTEQIFARTVSSGDIEVDKLLWAKTLEEVDRGHLSGPYQIDALPHGCLVNSRFPIIQGGKLHPIDNYTSSLVNDTVTISEKPITHSIDEVALLITRLTKAARKKGVKELYGKTADLKSAYRQLAISDESLKYSYLAVFDPVENKPKLFHQLAVPFGSTKAVYFFLRVARALWTILVKGALIPTTNYFDDFVLLALSGDRSSCSHAFDEVMKLLGWKLSEDKSTEWSTSFEALGVLFEIDQTGSGVLKVRNTEKRRKELISLIESFLVAGRMTQKEALQLRGRLQFAQAQFFGRLGRRCLNEITRHAYSGRLKLSISAKERMEEFGKFLNAAQPRLVGQVSCRTFMILTDAAFEKESRTGGLGGVLLTGSGTALSYFSVPISEQQSNTLSAQEEQTIIYELEMFGVLVGLKLLVEKTAAFAESYDQAGATAGTGVTCYIDNDAARYAYIAGSSKKGVAGLLIDEVNFLEYVHGTLPWYARVASPANLADEPSRMKLDLVRRLGFRDESVEATKIVLAIVAKASRFGE